MMPNDDFALMRGLSEYRISRVGTVANDRFVGFIDGVVLAEGDKREDVLAALILSRRHRRLDEKAEAASA